MTSNGDVVSRWKEHIEELLDPRDMPPSQESGPEASGMSGSISLVEVTKVVVKRLSTKKTHKRYFIQKEIAHNSKHHLKGLLLPLPLL